MLEGMKRFLGFRKLANESLHADQVSQLRLQLLQHERDRLTKDVTRVIPQLADIIDGLIRDTDELLQSDPDAYEEIFDDDQIATSLDNAFLPVAQSMFTLEPSGVDSAKLVGSLREFALHAPGWTRMVQDLCYAEVTGLRIQRMLWRNVGTLKEPIWAIDKFLPKDKRRFRPGDQEWNNIYLIDSGQSAFGQSGAQGATGFRKPLVRENFIVHRWRDTEERLGWGKGIGPRLYRLAKYRRPLIHLLMQTLENSGGGIRFVELDVETLRGKSQPEMTSMMNAIRDSVGNAISGDAVVLPPGAKPNIFFPPSTAGTVIQEAVDGYIDQQVQKTVLGVTLIEDQGRVGSFALGKEHSKTAHRRMQFRADQIAETLTDDYIKVFARNNPWIFTRAGVPITTPVPRMRAFVPGGESIKEKTEVINTCKRDVLLTDYYNAYELTAPTKEEIDAKQTFVPTEAGPMPSLFGGQFSRSTKPWYMAAEKKKEAVK